MPPSGDDSKAIVSNTGPLISLCTLEDGFSFIRQMYDKIIVPPEVLNEASFHFSDPKEFLKHYGIETLIELREAPSAPEIKEVDRLDLGEIQAISLAEKLQLDLLIEEKKGRRIAISTGR